MDAIIVVIYNGARYELRKFGPSDLVAFERHFGVSASVFSEGADVRFEWVCFLVWRGLRKTGAIPMELGFVDEFLDGIEELDLVADEEESTGNPPVVDSELPVS